MNWWLVVKVAFFTLVVIIALVLWSGRARKITRGVFPELMRELLIFRKNGAIKRFDDPNSDFWFSVERQKGSGDSAVLDLRIPKTDTTLALLCDLRQTFDSNGFDWREERDSLSLVAKVVIPVSDIWAKSSGAEPAHAARLLLDSLEYPREAQFKLVELDGWPSDRWKARDISEI